MVFFKLAIQLGQQVSKVMPLIIATLFSFMSSTQADDKLNIGFVYVSPIGDAGWTYQHDQGRLKMEKALGDKIATKYVESVPEGQEAERVIRRLAQGGHNLIFTTSFGYMNPTIKVAKTFPKVAFEHATGYKQADNVGTYVARFYEGRYLAGIIAGSMTKSNTLGYITAFPIPEVIRGVNAYIIGAQSVNPDVKVKVIWVNSWFDPGKEREATQTLLSQGADVITHHTDSVAPVQTANEAGKYAIAYHSDMSQYGKNAHLTAVTHHWGDFYTKQAQAVLDGTWESGTVWDGIKEGMIDLAPINPVVPADVVAKVDFAKKAIADGSLHPLTGPINGQDGKERVAAGVTMTDAEIGSMDYFVQGVQGKL